MYKYIGHCINDELSDDYDMTRQRNLYLYNTNSVCVSVCQV